MPVKIIKKMYCRWEEFDILWVPSWWWLWQVLTKQSEWYWWEDKIDDTEYSSNWNWDSTHAPSKNAVYDVLWDIETLLSNI